MSTSNTASSTPAASPPVLAPLNPSTDTKSLASKSVALSSPSIFTHKEWIIPPRPKPGRKPAADTPPTKRKAQNRQAQRAFRERRAARVGELEEQMKKMEEQDAKEQSDLRLHIHQLEADILSHSQLLLSWQQRMQELEATITKERESRQAAEKELYTLRNSHHQKSVPATEDPTSNVQAINPYENVPLGCGNCSHGSRCECIEQAFDINNIAVGNPEAPSKRPHSPPNDEDNKRFHKEATQEAQSNEIDFTTRFSSKKPPDLTTATSSTSLPTAAPNPDPCGFCQDGTPCICAEMALEAIKSESRPNLKIENSTSTNSSDPTNSCINGPGTCAQCLSDATSTLFCKSLAASRPGYRPQNQPSTPAEFAPENNNDEDLPLTPSSNPDFPTTTNNEPFNHDSNNNSSDNQATTTSLTLSCADAYETLSRHPAFEQASQELSTWMPHLATVPGGGGGGKERTAFEVEAASVMGVLRFFDRRFGKVGAGGM